MRSVITQQFLRRYFQAVAAALCLLHAGCEKEPELAQVALPEHGDAPIELRVASVVNPRFKQLSEAQLHSILDKTRELVKIHFGLSVKFTQPQVLAIDSLFSYLDEDVKRERLPDIIDFRQTTSGDRDRMADSLYDSLVSYWSDREVLVDYVKPYLLTSYEGNDLRKLSYALADTHLQRLQYWLELKGQDGSTVIDRQPYNEWVWWDSIGYSDMPYDVVITNQLVASAEAYDLSVHSSLRGGITAGTATYSKRGRFNGYVYVMAYPMLNDADMLVDLRDDASYSEDQVINYTAATLAHELGHLLLHLGHPFGNRNCIMYPTPLLKYRAWYEALDAAQCPLGSEPAMTPGAVDIDYRKDW